MKNDNWKPVKILSLIVVLSLIVLYFIFNYRRCCSLETYFSPTTLGQAGDFYGGILGTIITIFGLYFIYRTYNIQNIQLDVAKKDSDLEIINKLYSDLLQEINTIQYRRIKRNEKGELSEELFLGLDALYNFDENNIHSPNSILNNLNSIIFSFDQLIFMAESKVKYKYQDMKNIMLTKIYFLYYSKITWPVFHRIYNNRTIIKIEGNPDYHSFLKNYKRLTKRTQDYLQKSGHIGAPITEGMIQLLSD